MRRKVMTKAAALVAVLVAGPAIARNWYGVDMDAVPWPKFCAGTQPVPVERGGGRCEVSHPASPYHGRFRDWSGRGKNPPPTCDIAASEYRRWTVPVAQVQDPWAQCASAWGSAIKARAQEPERFAEPFAAWRQRYFAPWLVGGEQ